eukprot:576360-Rhodomonas_salina.3
MRDVTRGADVDGRVTIQNQSERRMRLVGRHWYLQPPTVLRAPYAMSGTGVRASCTDVGYGATLVLRDTRY